MMKLTTSNIFVFLLPVVFLWGCGSETTVSQATVTIPVSLPQKIEEKAPFDTVSLEVTATAYTSNAIETDSSPGLTAWGDTLKPGMKAIAISRDLVDMGLTHNTKVTIDGLDGEYIVLDKMHGKWTRKIDIYMGLDRNKAKNWGKKKVTIRWLNWL